MRTQLFERYYGETIKTLNVDDVIYLQSDCKYIAAHHADGVLLLDESLIQLEHDLGDRVLRINRGILVARNRPMRVVRDEMTWKLQIEGVDKLLPIARRLAKSIRAELSA